MNFLSIKFKQFFDAIILIKRLISALEMKYR